MTPAEGRFEKSADRLVASLLARTRPAGSATTRELRSVEAANDPEWVDRLVEAVVQRFALLVLREQPMVSAPLVLAQFLVLVQEYRQLVQEREGV